jgi:uncharacterized protein YndB with AHSA1/START domain
MTIAIKIAPVRKSIRVNASPAQAFEVFTSGLGRWWPRDIGIGKLPMKAAVMETRLGGRWYELAEDGTQTNIGKVIVWEPPQRFVVTWEINSQWKPDTTVRLGSRGSVHSRRGKCHSRELEHRKFEQLGAEGGESVRTAVDGGWPTMLQRFKNEVEAS